MDTTRRAIIRGIVATPVAAAAGGLVFAGTAEAAGDNIKLKTVRGPGGTGVPFAEAIRGLRNTAGLTPATVRTVLGDLDRQARPAGTDWPGAPDRLSRAFRWDPADVADDKWRPQGITSMYDASGAPGNNILVASWYGREETNNYYQGAKVTFINANSSVMKYRHVLLVEPVRRFDEEKAWYDFQPVRVHAGGIAWYKHRLYVADSERGALRVFNTDEMFRVNGYAKEHCGLHGGAYHAFGNGYVLPQGRIYDLTGSKKLRFSQVALDRTTSTESLVVSEWIDGAKSTRIARWNLNKDSKYGYLSRLTSRPTVRIDNGGNIQGAVSVRKTFYLSVSDGKKSPGFLKTARPRGGVAEAKAVGRVPAGPEDMSYQAVRGTPGRIWSLNEYENNRYVYAIRL